MKSFHCSSSLHEWKIRSCHTTWHPLHTIFFSISITARIFTFSLKERTSRLLSGLEVQLASLLSCSGAIIMVNEGFLNTNTAITWQLIQTGRTLEEEWWQVCGEAWVWGQRKISQVLGMCVLLHFTILWPVLAWRTFWNLWSIYFFNFPNFFSGRSELKITETKDTESTDTGVRLHLTKFYLTSCW
jgi:hypothetical protein